MVVWYALSDARFISSAYGFLPGIPFKASDVSESLPTLCLLQMLVSTVWSRFGYLGQLKGTIERSPNREPQRHSGKIPGVYLPGSLCTSDIPVVFLGFPIWAPHCRPLATQTSSLGQQGDHLKATERGLVLAKGLPSPPNYHGSSQRAL